MLYIQVTGAIRKVTAKITSLFHKNVQMSRGLQNVKNVSFCAVLVLLSLVL